jgi:hypothetical protein
MQLIGTSTTYNWRDNIRSKHEGGGGVLIPSYMPNTSQLLGPRRFNNDRGHHLVLFVDSHGLCLSNMWHTQEPMQKKKKSFSGPNFPKNQNDSTRPALIQHSISWKKREVLCTCEWCKCRQVRWSHGTKATMIEYAKPTMMNCNQKRKN